jgi:hypothetical protein
MPLVAVHIPDSDLINWPDVPTERWSQPVVAMEDPSAWIEDLPLANRIDLAIHDRTTRTGSTPHSQ